MKKECTCQSLTHVFNGGKFVFIEMIDTCACVYPTKANEV